MFDYQYGILNYVLRYLGLTSESILWLSGPQWALFSVIAVDVWRIFPFAVVVALTALQTVDPNLYDAAKIDGANAFSQFRFITFPSIRPTLSILILLFSIWSLKRFETAWILTQGGPAGRTDLLVVKVYREAFRNHHTGYASTVAMVGLAISLIVAFIYFRVEVKKRA
jgi:multiple sugar transport system permease protein